MLDKIEQLSDRLRANLLDWSGITAVFVEHVHSGFLEDFVHAELVKASEHPDHITARGVGQGSFTFINTVDFEYSVRILTAFSPRPHPVKWAGARQIVGVVGSGVMTTRVVKVAGDVDIESFEPGRIATVDRFVRSVSGDVITSDSGREILDPWEVDGAVALQTLTQRTGAPAYVWTFDHQLAAAYVEHSSLTVSRFRNVLALAHAEGRRVPDAVYRSALRSDRPEVILLAIQSMLQHGHPDAFAELHRATASAVPALRAGACQLFDAMLSRKAG